MHKVDFSLSKWNFTVHFNKESDYKIYKEVIENSVYDMYHKKTTSNPIIINYINDKALYNDICINIANKDKQVISSFQNEFYDKYDNVFVSSKNRYLIYRDNNTFNIICKENMIRPELIYIIREIYVRLQENDKGIFMHGNGIKINDEGLVIIGNSGSGKTTFMFKLFEGNKGNLKYLSNDRIFIKDNHEMEYFPIPLILATGTARGIKPIFNYLKDKDKLYDSSFSKDTLLNGKENEKFELFKNYIPKIFPNCELEEKERVNRIIIPKINFNDKKVKIEVLSDYHKAMDMCFTPIDYESLRKPWIMDRNLSNEKLQENSERIIKKQVDEELVYTIEYNPLSDSKYIQEEVKEKILMKK